MKNYKLIILLVVFSLVSCNDAIFYKITVEPPMIEPLIGGSPTNFVEYNSKLYIASGKNIFSYGKNEQSGKYEWSDPAWQKLDSFVINLAVVGDSLYAVYLSGDSGKIRRYYKDGNPIEVEILPDNVPCNVQSIYASNNYLFACIRNDKNAYAFYYKEDEKTGFKEISLQISDTEKKNCILKGVAFDGTYYYLCTNYGIFYVNKHIDSPLLVPGANYVFTGIINLNANCVAAISERGDLHEISISENGPISKKVAGFNDGRYSTGALALWHKDINDKTPSLLLAGRYEDYYSTTSAYSNGYVEIELDETGKIKIVLNEKGDEIQRFREPGKSPPTSIDDYDRYTPSLGKKLINNIIQTPFTIDENMTMFASTQQDGLWSYKKRDNIMIWNAEE
ncbi:hypothetical protein R84B8_01998 [Treponema sp. R8-4-B8]